MTKNHQKRGKEITLVLGIIAFLLVLSLFTYAIPLTSFTSPSPPNNTWTRNTSLEINASIIEANLGSVIWNFNNTNYTLYADSLGLFYNGNNTNDTISIKALDRPKTAQLNLRNSNISNGLVLALDFNNQSIFGETSSFVADLSNYGNNGTVNTTTIWNSSGKYGGAYQVDGIGSGIIVNDSDSLNPPSGLTVAAWIKASAWAGSSYQGTIIGKDDWGGAGSNSHGYVLRSGNNGQLSFVVGTSAQNWPEALTSSIMSTGTWYFVVGVFNGTWSGAYINGVLNGSTTFASTTINRSYYPLVLGKGSYDATRNFNGTIDSVRIWNRSLSLSEIQQIYLSTLKINSNQWYLYVNQTQNSTTGLSDASYNYRVFATNSSGSLNSTDLRTVIVGLPSINLNWIYPTTNINISQNSFFNISVNVTCLFSNCNNINVTLDPSSNVYNFTNCNSTGAFGPTQTNCTLAYNNTSLQALVNVTRGYQRWVVPSTGRYRIEAAGAGGGLVSCSGYSRSYGAKVTGEFDLAAGEVLFIVVGQLGSDKICTDWGGSGGGFSAIVKNVTSSSYRMNYVYPGDYVTPLIIAAGAGGSGDDGGNSGSPNATNFTPGTGAGGLGGGNSGGGAGFIGDGAAGSCGGTGALSFLNGSNGSACYSGGFGGGGAPYSSGGGGGGYTGGNGSEFVRSGWAGTSYNSGTNQINTSAANVGHGYVIITYTNGKGGTVSMNSSATPFYTNITNPYNLSLAVNESRVITWFVNATGIINNPYSFFVYVNSTNNPTIGNQTSSLNITIIDTTYPIVNITYPMNGITYSTNINSINYTYIDTNSGSCWYSNSSGLWNSTSVSAGVNFTNVTSLEGTNTWTVYCNDSANNLNFSSITFEKRIPRILLNWIYPTTSINVSQNNFFNISVNVSCLISNCNNINVTLDPASTLYNFTTCGTSGQNGPTQTQCNNSYNSTNLAGLVTVFNGTQNWTVPSTGIYTIEAVGASGVRGPPASSIGGYGADIVGTFTLNAGTVLSILVGQSGTFDGTYAGGGGGGTFVVNRNNNDILVIAGGGGSGAYTSSASYYNGRNASSNITGVYGSDDSSLNANAPGTNGAGGVSGGFGGGAGAGYIGNGSNAPSGSGVGGKAYISGGAGATAGGGASHGGFGGGGSGWGGGGGGGGYNGGGGGGYTNYGGGGGGGSSVNNGTNQNNTIRRVYGSGYVLITYAGGKGGTVSMNSSATPFWTNITNPYNLTLNVNESRVITWFVNATGSLSTYEFFVYTNSTSNSSIGNQTSPLNITIRDTTYPIINITYPLNTTYTTNINSINYTYIDTNSGSCWYSNSSGLWNSTSVSAGVNFTNVTSLEGTNTWTVYCNDSSGNINSTSTVFSKIIPRIGINLLDPTGNINVTQNQTFSVSVNLTCLRGNCSNLNVTLDPSSTIYNFTTCGASGRLGPNQTQCNTNYTNTTLAGLVTVSNGTQNWTVPSSGVYTIEVAGASGGNSTYSGGALGGNGSRMRGDFVLTAGQVLKIVVGQKGGVGNVGGYDGGGGGGSFVIYSNNTPLIIAGGGGGAAYTGDPNRAGMNAVTIGNGTYNRGTQLSAGGTNGSGGAAGTYAGGGGGLNGNGTNGASGGGTGGEGGRSFVSGAYGGRSNNLGDAGEGGFGGGGGAYGGAWDGGGGGGYSGGGSGRYSSNGGAGGGGSYNDGTNQNNTAGIILGNGYVLITTLSSAKGGTVSMNSSATPFWTNITNPYNLSLNEGESQIITWVVNATGSANSTYNFFVYANTTADLTIGNYTQNWNVTITGSSSNSVSFVSPTLPNGTSTTNTSVLINASITNSNLSSVIYNWNNTNFTIYNDSLVLMMNFDNISSLGENATNVVDVSKYSNNATLINGTSWNSSGKFGGTMQFDGINDYIDAPLVTNKIENVTISAWFKTNKYNQAGQMVIYVGSDSAANGYGLAVNQEATTDGTFYALYGGVAWYDSGRDITDSNWHQGVLVINSTGRPNLYLDGVFVYGSATGTANTPTTYVEIGRNNYAAARYFNGSIDEVRIWNRSLSASEIYEQYVSNLQKVSSTQWYLYVNQSRNTTTPLGNGIYNYQIFNSNTAQTDLRYVTLDTVNPNATLISPQNNTISNNLSYNFTLNLTDNSGIKNATLYIYNSTSLVNQTVTSFVVGTVQTTIGIVVNLVNGVYNWFYKIFDFAGNVFTTSNSTLTVDTLYPSFSSYQDNNGTPAGNTALFNVTLANTNGTVWLRINNTNYSASNITSTIYTVSVSGLSNTTYTYNWSAYGSGANKNLNISNTRNYTVNASTNPCVNLSDNSTYQSKITAGSGFYNITQNITLCQATYNTTQDMLRIQSNNIVIDCNSAILIGDSGAGDIAIEVFNKENITIKNCIVNNFYDGIYLSSAKGSRILNNTLNNNSEYGLYVLNSDNVFIANNSLANNTISYYTDTCNYNNFNGNNILGSKTYGMTMRGKSSANIVYNNYFKNIVNIRLDASDTNYWNITRFSSTNIAGGNYTAGNYWLNPSGSDISDLCSDANGDGICDTSYTIKNKNTDFLPLAKRDNSPPNVSIFTASNSSFVNGNLTIQASATDDFNVVTVLFQYKNSSISYTKLCNVSTPDSGSSNIYSCLWPSRLYSNASEGYDFKAIAYDAAGNNATSIAHYYIDRSIPYAKDLRVTYPSGQSSIRNGQTILLGINASDASEDGISSGINNSAADITSLNNTGNTTMIFSLGNKSTAQWSWWNISIIINSTTGQKNVPVYVRDNTVPLNNQRSSDRFFVQVDNNPPTYDSVSDNSPVYNNQQMSFMLNAYDNYLLGSYIFSSNLSGNWLNDSEVLLSGLAASISNIKTVTTGNYSYRFFIKDNAGNINATSIQSFQVLGNLPVFTVNLLTPNDSSIFNYNTINFSFSYYNGVASNCTLILDGLENTTLSSPSNETTTFINKTLAEGTHTWNIECYDNNANRQVYGTSRSLIIDTSFPRITITYPTNTTYGPSISLINYTYSESNIYGCWYSLNNGLTNSSLRDCDNFTGLLSSEGSNTWRVYIKDLANNINASSVTFLSDSTPPNASLITPVNATTSNNNSYNFTANLSDSLSGIKNATLNIYNSTSLVNQTTTSFAEGTLTSTVGIAVSLVNGIYNWFYSLFDLVGNQFTTSNNTLIVDTTYPRFSSYGDNNASLTIRGLGLFNVTVINTNGTVWLNINNTNISATNISANIYNVSYNFTLEGVYSYKWYSYGNGSNRNINSSSLRSYTVKPSPTTSFLNLDRIFPLTNINVDPLDWFNVSVNVTCLNSNCSDVNVTLDPATNNTYSVCKDTYSTWDSCIIPNASACSSANQVIGTANTAYTCFNRPNQNMTFKIGDEQTINSINITIYLKECDGYNRGYSFYLNGNRLGNSTARSDCSCYPSTTVVVSTVLTNADQYWLDGVNNTISFNSSSTSSCISFWTAKVNYNSGKGGIISMNSSATPFYTNITNPYNLSLAVNESRIITWWVRATGSSATFPFFAYTNLTSNLSVSNITTLWNVTINSINDSIYPIFSNFSDSNSRQVGVGIGSFNVTVINTNGTVWLNINNTNISATNISANIYNVSYNFTRISNYTYRWYAYGNGTLKNLNNSELRNYNLSLGDSTPPLLTIISPLARNYTTTSFSFNISSNENLSWCGYSLDSYSNITMTLNSTGTGANYTNSSMSQGSHTLVFSCNDTNNNFNSTSRNFFIDNIPPLLSFSSPQNTTYTASTISISLINNSDARTVWFNRGLGNETYTSNLTKTFLEGTNILYAWANDSLGNLNSTSVTFFVDSIAPSITVNSPIEKTYEVSTVSFNISSSENSYCWLALNSSDNYTMQTSDNRNFNYSRLLVGSPATSYSIIYYCNDSLNNIRTKTVNFGVKIDPPIISLNYPKLNNYYRNSTVQFNYTPYASDGLDTCQLWGDWNGGWHKNDSTTSLSNNGNNYFTKLLADGSYKWNIWCNNTNNLNDWSTQGNITFIIDQTAPYVSFVYPENRSYNSSIINIQIINNSDANYIWWNNGTTNTSYTTSLDILLSDGHYSYIAYANDTAGNLNSTTISFDIDTLYPSFTDYYSNNGTLIGNGTGLFNITINNTNGTVWLVINNTSISASNLTLGMYNVSYYLPTNNTFAYYWIAYSNGTSHLLGTSETLYYVVNNTDVVSPTASLISPENLMYINQSSINFSALLNDTTLNLGDTESGIKNATLSIYNSTSLVNQTTASFAESTLATTVGISVTLIDGIYNWFYKIFDFAGNIFVTSNSTVIKDSTAPIVTVVFPENNSNLSSGDLEISYTVGDSNLDSCWYDDEGYSSGVILEDCENISGFMWVQGQHTITVYANDSSGNIASRSVIFFLDSQSPTINLLSPEEGYSNDSSALTSISFNCSAEDSTGLVNLSLYLTNSFNQNLALNQTRALSGTSNSTSWNLNLGVGNYSWNCYSSDTFGNIGYSFSDRSLVLNFTDSDNDNITDSIDTLIGNKSNVNITGIGDLNITIGGNSTYGSFDDVREVAFYDSEYKLVNFTYNFTGSHLNLNKISIIQGTNFLIANLSSQLQSEYPTKSMFLEDNNFTDLCAKDAEVSSISEMTSDCSAEDETNFSDCIGNSLGINRNGLFCIDEGNIIRVDNLIYSALRGTVNSTIVTNVTSPSSNNGGGGGGGSKVINLTNKTETTGCTNDLNCNANEYCFANKCYSRECTSNSDCREGKSCWNYRCVKLFDIKILDIDSPIDAGSFITFTYFLKAMAEINNDVVINFWIEKNGESITSGKDTLYIGSFEEKTEKAKIFIPNNIEAGNYDFYVSVTYDKYSAESHRQIQIDEYGNIISLIQRGIFFYLLPLLILIIILLSIIVIKLEKKKIKDFFDYEEEWVLTHKLLLALLYICIFTIGLILILGYFNIVHLPLLSDYTSDLHLFIEYVIAPYALFIIGITLSILILSLILGYRRKKHKENNGEKWTPPKKHHKNYLEHGLKKVRHKILRARINRKIKVIDRQKLKEERKIEQWKKKGYDAYILEKTRSPNQEQLDKWKKKGYDVDLISKDNSQKKLMEEWKKKGFDVDSLLR